MVKIQLVIIKVKKYNFNTCFLIENERNIIKLLNIKKYVSTQTKLNRSSDSTKKLDFVLKNLI
jgi:hypothetical protein